MNPMIHRLVMGVPAVLAVSVWTTAAEWTAPQGSELARL